LNDGSYHTTVHIFDIEKSKSKEEEQKSELANEYDDSEDSLKSVGKENPSKSPY
jgi:hypothetical protein